MADFSSDMPVLTGRMLVLLDDRDNGHGFGDASSQMFNDAGIRSVVLAADEGSLETVGIDGAHAAIVPELGVAIVTPDPDQAMVLSAIAADLNAPSVIASEPETVVWAIGEYLRGFGDGVAAAIAAAGETGAPSSVELAAGPTALWADDDAFTWGVKATHAASALDPGRRITVAVLDTGLASNHPDVLAVASASFIPGESVEDGNGHGTHCCGVVAGVARPRMGPRFGVAPGVDLIAGKVLSNHGSGGDGGIIEGLRWALTSGAAVVSMSLGAERPANVPSSVVFETVAQRALAQGLLMVAAAGNGSHRRFGQINPVGHPANCASIMAVAAIDNRGVVADFSNGSAPGRVVDIAGPGVDVRSAWLQPMAYRTISGTSMATPHVAGIAALIAAETGNRGAALRAELLRRCRTLNQNAADVGAGLVSI